MIPLVLVGVVTWLVMSSGTEPAPEPQEVVTAPVVPAIVPDLEVANASTIDDDRGAREVAVGPENMRADSGVEMLRFEIVDDAGRPFEVDVDVEYSVPRVVRDAEYRDGGTGRGPRVEFLLRVRPMDEQVMHPPRSRPIDVVVRGGGLRGDARVQSSSTTDADWPRIVMRPFVVVRGSLVDTSGAPIEGVPILLRDDTPGKTAHDSVSTDAAGAFAIDALPDRANRLYVGDPVYPWVPPIAIDAKNGPFVLEPIRVELFRAEFRVQRADGGPASGARLDGIGLGGGRFGVTVDEDGRALVTTLLRGRWRVNASDPTHGRANRAVEIPLATDEPVLILLPR